MYPATTDEQLTAGAGLRAHKEYTLIPSQGGKNRRRGKNENDNEKRELTFKEEGQGTSSMPTLSPLLQRTTYTSYARTTDFHFHRICTGRKDAR
jgi:hypothetical protein